ncbi:hypothetical protein CB1_001066029 [Camelus ferus]|nr:hypothetical protein CB1_001066029 [Camelus ferus]
MTEVGLTTCGMSSFWLEGQQGTCPESVEGGFRAEPRAEEIRAENMKHSTARHVRLLQHRGGADAQPAPGGNGVRPSRPRGSPGDIACAFKARRGTLRGVEAVRMSTCAVHFRVLRGWSAALRRRHKEQDPP